MNYLNPIIVFLSGTLTASVCMLLYLRPKLKEIYMVAIGTQNKIDRAVVGRAPFPALWKMITQEDYMPSLDEVLQAVRDASTRTDSIIADRAAIKRQCQVAYD